LVHYSKVIGVIICNKIYVTVMVKVVLIRHGESETNKMFSVLTPRVFSELCNIETFKQHINGMCWDPQLTLEGVKQAIMTRKRLDGMKFDAVYVSPLFRAMQTASFIFAKTDAKLEVCIHAREFPWGHPESLGRLLDDLKSGYLPGNNYGTRLPLDTLPGGEGKYTNLEILQEASHYWDPESELTMQFYEEQVQSRENFENIANILNKHTEHETVCIVCHGNFIREFANAEVPHNCGIVECMYSSIPFAGARKVAKWYIQSTSSN
jgi:broad specificity phosphatase PhoE